MKNKILKKILLLVVCVSVLVSVLVVPSFAYNWNNPTPQNNNVGYFNLPETSIVLKRNNLLDVSDDLPYNIYLPTSSNFSKTKDFFGGLTYQLNDGRESQFRFYIDTVYNNVYDTSYYYSGYFRYYSTNDQFDYHLYELESITYGDVWIMGQTSTYVNSVYNSLYLSLECEPFYILDGQLTDLPYVIASYDITYIDRDGILQNEIINTNLYLETFTNDKTDYYATQIFYLPEYFNGNNVTYIESVNISLFADSQIFCFVDAPNLSLFYGECGFTNRLVPSSVFSDEYYNNMIDNVGDVYYDDGYGDGYRDASQANAKGPFEILADAVDTFINWEFIPGISVGIVLTIVIGISLLIAFLKIFAGG